MKKIFSFIIVLALLASILTGCSTSPSTNGENNDTSLENGDSSSKEVTIYTIMSTDPDFKNWKQDVEEKTGVKLNVIAAPTDSDTRQQKITTVLSSNDDSIDIIEINDEMAGAFKNTGWLEPLQDTVMTSDIIDNFAKGYLEDALTSKEGDILGVPGYSGYLAFWVNQEKLEEAGMSEIKTKDDFVTFIKASTKDGNYGYGGSWEKTYVFNEIGTFINLFGGDYFDWTNPNNKEALEFLYDMTNTWEVTPKAQFADKYEQMNQKFIDGKYGCLFMWGSGSDYERAGVLGDDKIHIAPIPEFKTKSVFTDSWSYVLNKSSTNKESSIEFLKYVSSVEGNLKGWEEFDRYPARKDAADDPSVDGPIKNAYKDYQENSVVRGRPMLPQTMEFIADMGTIFQSYIDGKITVDEFCIQAQKYVEAYS